MRKIVLIFYVQLLVIICVNAQDDKFKALFMVNFTRYLEWPAESLKENFIIGVYGSSPIIDELNLIAHKKTVGNQKIVIKKINTLIELKNCNIIYIPEHSSGKAKEISDKCDIKGTLIISDYPGLAETIAGINYIKIHEKVCFEINEKNIEDRGIKVNSELLMLGIEID